MTIKLNVGDPATKKTVQLELDEQNSTGLQGKKLGEKFKGELVDKAGWEFQITGGSDKAGFPMRSDVEGSGRKKVLITTGIGNRKRRKGLRLRRTVAGNTVGTETVQLNVKAVKQGKAPLVEAPAPEGEAPADDSASKEELKPAEAPKETAKTEAKLAEEKPAEKTAEKPTEAPKETAKTEAKLAEEKPAEKRAEKPAEEKKE